MDSVEFDFTEDERRAERAATLAVFFMNAQAPVPTSVVEERFYAELGEGNRQKTFSRDRKLLAEAGVHIREAGKRVLGRGGTEKLWAADAEASFANGAELEPLEAIALDAACQPLLEDPGFVLAGALRRALTKIDRTFGDADQAIQANAPQVSAIAEKMLGCIEDGVAAEVRYRGADGIERERVFAPLGTFSVRGNGYVVGDMVDEDGARRTLRLDRILQATTTSRRYDAPAGFDVADYRVLPFQIGNAEMEVVFAVPAEAEAEVRKCAAGKGRFGREGDRLVWRVEAASAEDAARWAVAQGIRPISPKPVVEAWKRCLKGAMNRG